MMKKCYFLALSFCFLVFGANAQLQRVGFEGGKAYCFYEDAGMLYLASNTGVFSSVDNGINWTNTSLAENVFDGDSVLSVAASPNEVYAATANHGIYRSVDGGATWSTVNTGMKTSGAFYSDLEIINNNTLVIRADSGLLFRTVNQGFSWQPISLLINNSRAYSLSKHNGVLYVVTNLGLYTSVNNGVAFTNINPTVNNGKLFWANDTAYLATNNGVMQSLDNGVNFSMFALAGKNVTNVAASGKNIYASVHTVAGEDTIKCSQNYGASFFNSGPQDNAGILKYKEVFDFFISDSLVLVGTDFDVYATKNQGVNWDISHAGFYSTSVHSVAAMGTDLFAATVDGGVYMSPDSAKSWVKVIKIQNTLEGRKVTLSANKNFLFLGVDRNIFQLSPTPSYTLGGLTAAQGMGNISSIYAVPDTSFVWAIKGGDLYLSVDDGIHFIQLPSSSIPPGTAEKIMGMDSNLFVTAGVKLFHAGANSVFYPTSIFTTPVTSVIRFNRDFYAGTNGTGLYSSTDGNTWTPVAASGLPLRILSLAVDSNNLIAGTMDGVYRERAGTWTADTLQGKVILSLFEDDGHLLIGTTCGLYTKPYPKQVNVNVPVCRAPEVSFAVYPNPVEASRQVTIFSSLDGAAAQLLVFDAMGKLVFAHSLDTKASPQMMQLPTSIPAGSYFFKLITAKGGFSQSVLLK